VQPDVNRRVKLSLYLVLFIDGLGLGILYPVLNSLFLNPHYHFFTHAVSSDMRHFVYGLTIGIYTLAWFFGAPLLADLSDQLGRKRTLVIALWGTFLGYVLTAIGVWQHWFSLILLGRVIDGFTAGSQPIAQAAVVDLSPQHEKAKSIARVLLFLYLGFVAGPIIGGLLTHTEWVSWFGLQTPLLMAAILAFINIMLLQRFFHETYQVKKLKVDLLRPIRLLFEAIKEGVVSRLALALLVSRLAWSLFFSFSGAYAVITYHFSPLLIMVYMALIGVGFALGSGLTGPFEKHCLPLYTLVLTSLLSALGYALFVLIHSVWVVWLLVIPVTALMTVFYNIILALFSHAVDDTRQGWVMGVTMSLTALSFAVTGFVGGGLLNISAATPLWVGCGLTIITAALLFVFSHTVRSIVKKEG
jgi:MFS transporter, DHA1 family, tetracycline resistance protein